MMRNFDFLKSIIQEKNSNRRRENILKASKYQINATNERIMNMLKKRTPLSPLTVAKLKKYSNVLREVAK